MVYEGSKGERFNDLLSSDLGIGKGLCLASAT